ncbi:metallophosphoesterase [Pueribacillus theae]|uniref:Metallophosphoesterase n=1 Tax=Pueribacillus theae TaxID=2171751 RepID=A0A2U1K711_9BACI|nr:metallophosphoesterase [Pueribacillus theae]PWA12678.1 metallophosphoesterase [Pueribacillus theae]
MLFFILLSIALLLIGLLFKAYKNTKDVVINEIEIPINGVRLDGTNLQILHISDLHLENISVTPEDLYEHLKDRPIDLIALTGDFLDRKRSIPKLKPYLKILKTLKPKHGIYAVFGNHDYVLRKNHLQLLEETLRSFGCHILKNEYQSIEMNGEMLNIIGIDDYSTNRSNISASYSGVGKGINLVLTHDPNIVLEMENVQYDYLLSGHFHGGQIHWPKPYHLAKMGKLVQMNIVKGLHMLHGKRFYISEGLGQTGVNIRVGSRPEVTVHNLIFSKTDKKSKNTLTAV